MSAPTKEQAEALAIAEKWEKDLSGEIATGTIEPYIPTDAERREFAEAFEEAHQRGEVSDRNLARARIEGALAQWTLRAWEAAGSPRSMPDSALDAIPEIEAVGVPAIDAALPYLKPNGGRTRADFLNTLLYLLKERDDALEVAEARAENLDKAAALLREAAALLDDSHTAQLAKVSRSLAEWAGSARYGWALPTALVNGRLQGHYRPDAMSARLTGKRGGQSRDANVVKSIAEFFPDTDAFLSRSGGYAIIGRLAALCGLGGKTAKKDPHKYARSVLESNERAAKAEAPKQRRGNSIVGLLAGGKHT